MYIEKNWHFCHIHPLLSLFNTTQPNLTQLNFWDDLKNKIRTSYHDTDEFITFDQTRKLNGKKKMLMMRWWRRHNICITHFDITPFLVPIRTTNGVNLCSTNHSNSYKHSWAVHVRKILPTFCWALYSISTSTSSSIIFYIKWWSRRAPTTSGGNLNPYCSFSPVC